MSYIAEEEDLNGKTCERMKNTNNITETLKDCRG
jgi:hypothetical protein